MSDISSTMTQWGLKAAAATMTARQTLSEIGHPPVVHDEETGEPTVKGSETDSWVTSAQLGVVGLIALSGLVSGLISFVVVAGHLADLASFTLMVVAPLVIYQKYQLTALGDFRGQHNQLRQSINKFQQENQKLTVSIDDLSTQVDALGKVKDELDDIAKASGTQVERLVEIVHENGELQSKIKDNLRSQVLQNIITALLQSDRDHDFTIGPHEVNMLVMHLKNIRGIVLDEPKFRDFIKNDQGKLTLDEVMKMASIMLNDSSDQGVFEFRTKDLLK